jgi:hypothetical protein
MLPIEESRRRWEQRDTSHGITARLESANAGSSCATGRRDGLAEFLDWNEAQALAEKEIFRNWYAKALSIAQAHRQAGKARAPGQRIRRC